MTLAEELGRLIVQGKPKYIRVKDGDPQEGDLIRDLCNKLVRNVAEPKDVDDELRHMGLKLIVRKDTGRILYIGRREDSDQAGLYIAAVHNGRSYPMPIEQQLEIAHLALDALDESDRVGTPRRVIAEALGIDVHKAINHTDLLKAMEILEVEGTGNEVRFSVLEEPGRITAERAKEASAIAYRRPNRQHGEPDEDCRILFSRLRRQADPATGRLPRSPVTLLSGSSYTKKTLEKHLSHLSDVGLLTREQSSYWVRAVA